LSFEYRIITPEYMRAMGIPLLRGRDFNSSDTRDSKRVALIDEKLAKKYWPDQDPIGRNIGFDSRRWLEVIGVVGHVRNVSLSQEGLGQVYVPYPQNAFDTMYFVIHTQRDPALMLPEIRQQIRSIDRTLPLYRIQTMDQLASKAVAKPRFQVLLLGSFAVLALLLAAVGIYGVVSYSVNQRRNEIGVRMALGATHSMIVLHVIQTSMVPVVLGALAGVLGSVALNRLIQGLLFGISAINIVALSAAAFLILLIALAATLFPARGAARTDAAVVLRSE
jgi:putative ABC transport system permease protein